MTFLNVVLIILAISAIGLYARERRKASTLRVALDQYAAEATDLVERQAHLAARAAAVIDAPPHSLLVIDARGAIVQANRHAIALLGRELIGQTVIETTRSYEIDAAAQAVLKSRQLYEHPVTWKARSLYVRAVPIDGGGAVLLLEDQTELQRLSQVRRDFVANVSHELRTPLASIRLLVETLLAGARDDPAVASRMLNQVITEVDALTQLAQELLDLTMIESGQLPMKIAGANVGEMVEEQLIHFEPQAQQKKITLKNSVPIELEAEIDQKMISRVLGNLIHNALKFTPEGGQITIDATATADKVTVSVADTGVGIPHEDLPRIFERFYKVDRARGKSGTGLGLAIARHVVEAHGGKIWAESTPGKGATFYFTLPGAR